MAARRSVALLVNPTAGKGRAARAVDAVAGVLGARGTSVEPLTGRDAVEALSLARNRVQAGVDALVALGGDGMVNLALQAVAGTDVPLGVVPAGTGNDLAASLGLPLRDPAAAAGIVADTLNGPGPRRIDAARTDAGWFGCVLGAGFDSRVNDRANRMSWPRGRSRYNVAILAELRVFRPLPFSVTVDGETLDTEAMLVAVGNARSYGAGMQVCPDAVLDDGLLDVTVLGPVGTVDFLRVFPRVYSGRHRDHPAVRMLRGREVTLSSPGVSAYADGERLCDLPVTCTVVPGAVRVLAPVP